MEKIYVRNIRLFTHPLALEQAKFQSNLEKAQRKAKQFSEQTTQYLNNIEKAAKSINDVIIEIYLL